eukprot:UN10788
MHAYLQDIYQNVLITSNAKRLIGSKHGLILAYCSHLHLGTNGIITQPYILPDFNQPFKRNLE